MVLHQIYGVNFEHIPTDVQEELHDSDKNYTGLFCIDHDSKFGKWLTSQGFIFPKSGWDWVGIWN